MNIIRIAMVAGFTSIAFGISLFTAKIYSTGFKLGAYGAHSLVVIGIIIPILFILTMLFGQFESTALLQKSTYITNILAGIVFYLFFSALVLGIFLLVAKLIGVSLPIFVSVIFLCIGVGFATTGIIEARFFKIVSYTVHLPDAPKDWNKKTAVLVSDTHFGLINHRTFSDKVIERIKRLQPDFVLHAGDFYDGPKNNTALISESWSTLTATTPVFYTPGNHETYGDYNAFIDSIKKAGITTLTDSMTEYDGVQIAGITYRDKNQIAEATAALESLNADPAKALIIINHPPTFQPQALAIGADLMVSGHTHKGQLWPGQYIAKAVYKRFYYGLQEYKTLFTITTSGVGTAGPPLRLFNTPELVVIHFTTE